MRIDWEGKLSGKLNFAAFTGGALCAGPMGRR